jgi:4-hydroxybenzoate polyprenyltransferase
VQYLNLYKFYRVRDWIKNLGIVLIGTLFSGNFNWFNALLIGAAVSCTLAHTFSINDFYDFELASEKNYLGKKIIRKKVSKNKTILFSFIPLFLLFLLSLFLSLTIFLLLFLFLILADVYSCPPFRLKNNWVLSLIINSFCLGTILFFVGYFSMTTIITTKAIYFSLIFFSYILFSTLIHQLDHLKKDIKARVKSFPNLFGIRKTIFFLLIIEVLVIIFSFFLFIMDFHQNFIFVGTFIFNIFRILKIQRLSVKKISFSILRKEVYGIYEGLFYVIFLSIKIIIP